MGPADPNELNMEVEVCRMQRHQMLEGWGRIHLSGAQRLIVDTQTVVLS